MVIKVFLSGISASKEVKKRQQRALIILDSCKVEYESVDITEPGMEEERQTMHEKCKVRSPNRTPIAPQFFNEGDYCGDYDDFDSAVEVNQVLQFLKLEAPEIENGTTNGVAHNKDEEVENGTTHVETNEDEEEATSDKEAEEQEEA